MQYNGLQADGAEGDGWVRVCWWKTEESDASGQPCHLPVKGAPAQLIFRLFQYGDLKVVNTTRATGRVKGRVFSKLRGAALGKDDCFGAHRKDKL